MDLKPELSTHNWWGDGDCVSFWKRGLTAIGIADFIDYIDSYHNSYDLIRLFNYDYYLENTKLAFIITHKLTSGDNFSTNYFDDASHKSNKIFKATKGQIIELYKQFNPTDIEIYNILGIKLEIQNINDLTEGLYFVFINNSESYNHK